MMIPSLTVDVWKALTVAWRAMGVTVARAELDCAIEEAAEAWAVLTQLRGVATRLLPESELLRHLLVLQGCWAKASLKQEQQLLRLGPHVPPPPQVQPKGVGDAMVLKPLRVRSEGGGWRVKLR